MDLIKLVQALASCYYVILTLAATICVCVPQISLQVTRSGKLDTETKDQPLPAWIQHTPLRYLFIAVPKRWFAHFYVAGFGINSLILLLKYPGSVVSLLYQLHLGRRVFESFYIERHSNAKMLLAHYLIGITFYFVTTFNLVVSPVNEDVIYLLIGIAFFMAGQWIQHDAHQTLAALRSSETAQEYALPMRSWFQHSSSPHYFAEMLIYAGICMSTWNLGTFLCLIWVVINLGIMAHRSHTYYLQTFTDPKSQKLLRKRAVLIPLLY